MKKQLLAALSAAGLALAGFGAGISSPAKAAGLPTVRVVSPVFNSANETFANDGLGAYYAAGGRSYYMYVGAGSTITITYAVTTDGTTPAANQAIDFLANAPYSKSTAAWTINGAAVGPSTDAATGFGLKVSGTTDSKGQVSFTIVNTDSSANAESVPASETAPRATSGRLYGNMKAVIPGVTDMQQVEDLVTFDITKAAAATIGGAGAPAPSPSPSASAGATPSPTPSASATPTPTKAANPTIRLTSPVFNGDNSVDSTGDIAQYYSAKTKAFYTYLAAGSIVSLTYHVTTDGTTPAANKEVNLYVDSAYSGSKANWVSGSTKITAPAAADATYGAKLTGTTDAKGDVTFTLKNTDTVGLENAPTKPNQDRGAIKPARLFGTIKPMLAGVSGDMDEDTDLVTFDIYAGAKAPAATSTITCVKGKSSKKVSGSKPVCPKGYTLKK